MNSARILPMACALLLAACAHTPPPVVESPVVTGVAKPVARPDSYLVARGDTLYSIAFRFGLDYRELGALNGIPEPYTIYPGQKLRLKGSAAKPPVAVTKPPVTKTAPPATRPAEPGKPPLASASAGGWQWPVPGKVIGTFTPDVIGPKGVALAGNAGDPVRAARAGRVVYVGGNLVGYGQLVIIKHDDVYLSAYAHNSKLLVKEGDVVKAGDVIAEMGSTGTDRTKLHFEIRRNGDPVDPLQLLPRR